jgi:PAS domain S-box-containing protein
LPIHNTTRVATHRVRWPRLLALGLHVVVLVCPVAGLASEQAPASEKNVLILESFSNEGPDKEPIESSLKVHAAWPLNFYVEYLEARRFDDKEYETDTVRTLQVTYKARKLDLVMTHSFPALEFAVKHRNELFPGVPIVFWEVDINRHVEQRLWAGVTGVTDVADGRSTIDLALRLHPDTSTVAIITEDSPFERYWLAAVHAELVHRHSSLREVDLVALPPRELLDRVAELPRETVVLFQEGPKSSAQPALGVFDVLALVGQRRPTYCIWTELCLNHGGIGGVSRDLSEQLQLATEVARRVLSGEQPDNIPIMRGTRQVVTVDWRALQRWHIPESALPPGTKFLNREPTLWERGRKYFLPGIAVIVLQGLLILGLLRQQALRRKTETELRRSEEKFSKSFRQSPLAVSIISTKDGRYIDVNEAFEQQTGWRRDEVIGRTALDIDLWVDRAQRASFFKELQAMGNVRDVEVALRKKDGEIREIRKSAELIEVHGEQCAVSVFADITEGKQAEQVLASLSGRLIEAQEAERKRIARELHDDIAQKLALLTMAVEKANHGVNGSDDVTKDRLAEIQQNCSGIAHDVQSLSHQLHYSKLEYLGLVTALRSFCKEFAKQSGVKIEFTEQNVPRQLSNNIALCVFRVAQEALHNAVKYSGVGQFEVKITGLPNEIRLEVEDAGAGFDVERAKQNQGLGLLSMQERVHLVHGRFRIESKPGEGTTILASVPLSTQEISTEIRSTDTAGVPGAA